VRSLLPIAEPADIATPGGKPGVAMEDVTFTYRGTGRPALREVQLTIAPGEVVGIMGASGAGKSTLAKCLNRIVPAFEDGDFCGVVRIGGRPLDGARVCDVAPLVGMVFQDFESQLFSTNVAHEVAFAMEQAGMRREEIAARIGPALEAVGLSGFAHRDPTSLSGGEKQRLAIAAVLAMRPAVIVLDEPTTDLDPEGTAEVFALVRQLREQGLSFIIIEHDAEELRNCDRLVLVDDGGIVAEGPPDDLLTRLELLEACGVHPPGVNELFAAAGIVGDTRTIDQAEAAIRRSFPRTADAWPSDSSAAREPVPQPLESSAPVGNPDAPLVEVEKLSFEYPGGPRVLDSVDLEIFPGDFLAVIGQNGSGKTTLAKHMVGLLKPSEGRILLSGRDRRSMRPAKTAQEIGYVFQNPDHQIFAATVEDEVAFGPRNFGLDPVEVERRCADVLSAVGLEAARKSDPFLLGKGERQRLAVASILALRPRLLILDEPTTGLDYREQRRMMTLVNDLNRAGIAIVMITHTPWLVAEHARRVVLMRDGKKRFDGPVREFFAVHELLSGSSFRPPEVTALGRRFGITALSVDEFAAWLRERA
jgi:energy-coupling factor transport system ATP-binding protein